MNFWMLVQILFDLLLLTTLVLFWIRNQKSTKEDPRLSKGLQLLQSKISVLEDLSDQTEHQVQRIVLLIEQKGKELQSRIQEAEQTILQIESNIKKSMEVAHIFQDKIPHHEIIERQNSMKYINAAKLAHQGLSAEEISKQVELSMGEIEFITKVNRSELQFDNDNLPGWAHHDLNRSGPSSIDSSISADSFVDQVQKYHSNLSPSFEVPKIDTTQIEKLASELKASQAEFKLKSKIIEPIKADVKSSTKPEQTKIKTSDGKEKMASIRPFEFKRIDSPT